MTATAKRFLDAVTLTEVPPAHADRAFVAVPQYVPWLKAYGGDVVAQALAATIRTIDDDRRAHSVHATFLRPVEMNLPVRYEVELLRDGRKFSTRAVRGYQSEKVVASATVSFHVPEDGPILSPEMPQVPGPETLPATAMVLDDTTEVAQAYWAYGRSFDLRHVPGPIYLRVEGGTASHQAVWCRAFSPLPTDPKLHQIALAYVCDYTILESSLRALNMPWATPGLVTASLDHALWFHAHARLDEWLLYVQESVGISDGRGLNTGQFFARDGRLIATVAQEGMLRLPTVSPPLSKDRL